MRTTALFLLAAIATGPVRAQTPPDDAGTPPTQRPGQLPVRPTRRPGQTENGAQRPARAVPTQPPATPPGTNRPAIAPQRAITPQTPPPTRSTQPPPVRPIERGEAARRSSSVVMNFDKRDLAEVIQFVSSYTQRNFILPERVSGKITILSNQPIPPEEVWNVFVAALDANNWAVYPIGHYWKLSEKKQSARANIPTYLEPGQEAPPIEQMVTKLFKLRYVEADQMRNTLNQFTSRDSDFQIFPPDTLIISDLGLNMRRLERLIEQLDQPGGSEEIHIVQVQYASAQALQQKLQEIFTQPGRPGTARALGIAEVQPQPGQPPTAAQLAQQQQTGAGGGPVTVSKIIAEERTNKLIVIAGARSFSRVLELIRQLDVPAGGGGVNVYYLQNAKAEDVATTLQALAQGAAARRTGGPSTTPSPMGGYVPPAPPPAGAGAATAELFSGEVKITADKTTNSLVIIASASDYRNLTKVIEKLDIARREVLVEAVIMEVSLQDELKIGASAHVGTVIDNLTIRNASGAAPLVFGSELGGINSLFGITSLTNLSGFLAGLQGPPITVPGLGVTLPSLAVLVNALQTSSDVNVISTPHVTMVDNTEGEITVGQNVPFQAAYAPNVGGLLGSASTPTGQTPGALPTNLLGLGGLGSLYAPIQRQNVELRLRIKPQISASDTVRLEVDEQTEEIASTNPQLGPTTSKRSAKTTVVVKDQETVVLGGLIQERTVKGVSKVPFLGSLPILGWFFRSEDTTRTKTNLLLFLTPYIIRDQSDYRRIFERKMAERSEFVKRFYGADEGYQKAIDYERKTGMLTRLRRGVQTELSRAEHGGPGSPDERVIVPSRGETPPETQPRYEPQTPAPPTPQQKGPPPGAQETPRGAGPAPQQPPPPDAGQPQSPPNAPEQGPPPEESPPPRS
ncbi:MAG TPA: type II secretion system secretin GspD [Myxococcales bacterium]|nr:type II secretion system secretin GspD [Myxococcales bacterium]